MTSGNLQIYYKDEIINITYIALDGKSFEYKTKIVEKTQAWSGNEWDGNQPVVPT